MNENFLVTIFDWVAYQNVTIISKSKIELTKLINSLTEAQSIVHITPISNFYETEEYLKELRENLDDDMNFGKTN